jgi:hypothetical protein
MIWILHEFGTPFLNRLQNAAASAAGDSSAAGRRAAGRRQPTTGNVRLARAFAGLTTVEQVDIVFLVENQKSEYFTTDSKCQLSSMACNLHRHSGH